MMHYTIFQLREPHLHTKGFLPLEVVGQINADEYASIYTGEISGDTDNAILERLFCTFNMNHPADFRGHSLSVGDIVLLDGKRAWYCDMIGWVELTGEHAPIGSLETASDEGMST